MAFLRVVVICDWPTTVEKSWGLYFLAETMNLSMIYSYGKPTTNPGAGNGLLFLPAQNFLKKDEKNFGIFTLLIKFVLLIISYGNRREKRKTEN
jgi:hypothetical protein